MPREIELTEYYKTSTMRHMLLKHNSEVGKADPQQPSVLAIFTAARRSFNPSRVEKITTLSISIVHAAVLFAALNYLQWLGYLFRSCFFFNCYRPWFDVI